MSKKMIRPSQEDKPLQERPFTQWLFFSTLFSALLASACCWLPLLLLVLGLSTIGIAQILEQFRPFFLGITFTLLATAFYFTYRPQRSRLVPDKGQSISNSCLPPPQTEQCCSPSGSMQVQRLQRGALWFVTIIVLAFAFFPSYVGKLIESGKDSLASSYRDSGRTLTFQVKGMTCAGCATVLRQQLLQVPGVRAVDVDFKTGRAHVVFEKGKEVPSSALAGVVKKAGYIPVLSSESNSRG